MRAAPRPRPSARSCRRRARRRRRRAGPAGPPRRRARRSDRCGPRTGCARRPARAGGKPPRRAASARAALLRRACGRGLCASPSQRTPPGGEKRPTGVVLAPRADACWPPAAPLRPVRRWIHKPRTVHKGDPVSPLKRSNHIAARIGRWSANHWKTAVIGWLVFVAAAVFVGNSVGTKYLKTTDANVGEARKADKIIAAGFKQKENEQGEVILIRSKTLTPKDPAFRATINDVTSTLAQFPKVQKLKSPLAPGNDDQVSDSRHAVMVTFTPKGDYDHAATYIDTIKTQVLKTQARHPGFTVEELGSVSTEKQLNAKFDSLIAKVGLLALPAALIILLFVFGSAVAALLPLLLAVTAVVATTALVAIPSQFIPVDSQISEVILLIGLAVGIDYSLFYLRREREERAAGRS